MCDTFLLYSYFLSSLNNLFLNNQSKSFSKLKLVPEEWSMQGKHKQTLWASHPRHDIEGITGMGPGSVGAMLLMQINNAES